MEIPNNPTNHVAAQQYRMKSSIEEYEVNGLNALFDADVQESIAVWCYS